MGLCCTSGPSKWAKTYPIAVTGKRQSPIDICTEACHSYAAKVPLVGHYPAAINEATLINTGYGWKVDIPSESSRHTSLKGGPLESNYTLEQFHCHWGKDCCSGSEHTVDGKSYSAELHLVHWNSDKFSSFPEAASHDKGLAVLGVFLEVGQQTHEEFKKITSLMDSVHFKGEQVTITKPLNIDNLLPEDRAYWTYEGSLTTPPLYESVSWIVFKNPIIVTEEQIAKFRVICYQHQEGIPTEGPTKVVENFRPPQPICSRTVSYVEP